jgi:actin
MSEEGCTLVIDNGSGFSKAGFAGHTEIRSVFPSVVGHSIPNRSVAYGWHRDTWVGDQACAKVGTIIMRSPFERGIVTNWDDMEHIWHHTFFNELRVDPAEHPVLLTEAPLTPKWNREKMTQLQFETFNVPSFCVVNQPLLSLYSSGRTTGIVFEAGEGAIHIVPFHESHSLPNALFRLNLGGCDLTAWMHKSLTGREYTFATFGECRSSRSSWGVRDTCRDIKEKLGYVAIDFEAELEKAATTTDCNEVYMLPDSHMIVLMSERFRCLSCCSGQT